MSSMIMGSSSSRQAKGSGIVAFSFGATFWFWSMESSAGPSVWLSAIEQLVAESISRIRLVQIMIDVPMNRRKFLTGFSMDFSF